MAPTRSGIFKHLKFSENDKFTGTNSVDSILVVTRYIQAILQTVEFTQNTDRLYIRGSCRNYISTYI